MYLIVSENNEVVGGTNDFLEACGLATQLSDGTGVVHSVLQEVWNTKMLSEEDISEGAEQAA